MGALPHPDPDPFATILRELADARVDDAAAARSRDHWLARQAEHAATLAGALVELAERRAAIHLRVRGGREVAGTAVAVGADVVAVRTASGVVLVRLDRIGTIRSGPGRGAAPTRTGGPTRANDTTMAEVLGEAAADRRVVQLSTDDGAELRGELRALGADVLTLRADNAPESVLFVSLDAVAVVGIIDRR